MSLLTILLFSLFSFITGARNPGAPQQAELIFVGDAMMHQAQIDKAKELGGGKRYNYDDCFTLIAPTVTNADYAVVNLETPLGGGPSYTGFPCFSAPDSYAVALQDAGFDMFLTANNHSLDRHDKGVRRTVEVLDSLGVDHTGSWHNSAEREKKPHVIKNIKGFKVGFLNYTYGTNGIKPKSGAVVALIDRERMKKDIRNLRDAGAEIVTVCIHWGEEYQLRENSVQRSLAQFLKEQKVDLIIGSHPHVIQPMEMEINPATGKNTLVVYSLGNFLSNMKTNDTRGGALARVILERDSNGTAKVKEASYDTFYAAKPSGAGTNYQVVPSWTPSGIPAQQKGWWNTFNNRATGIFNRYNRNVSRWHNID